MENVSGHERTSIMGFLALAGVSKNNAASPVETSTVQLSAERTSTSSLSRIPIIGSAIAFRQHMGRAVARFAASMGVLPSSTRQIQPGTALANAYETTARKHTLQRQQITVEGSRREIDSLYRECPRDKKADGETRVVLYLNSNSELMGDHVLDYDKNHAGPIRMAEDLGVDVMMLDYGGTGASEGTPSTKGITQDVVTALRYLTEEKGIDPKNIIVYGRSLGGAAALAGTDEFLKQKGEVTPPVVAVDRSFKTYASAAKRVPGIKKLTHGIPGLPTLIAKAMSLLGANMDSMKRARSLKERECKIIGIKNIHDRVVTENASFVPAANRRALLHAEVEMTQTVQQHQGAYEITPHFIKHNLRWVENNLTSGQRLFIRTIENGKENVQEIDGSSWRVDEQDSIHYCPVDGAAVSITQTNLTLLRDNGWSAQMFFCDGEREPRVSADELAQTFRDKSPDQQFCILIGNNWCPVEPEVRNGHIRVIGETNDRPLPDPIMVKTIDAWSDASDAHNISLQSDPTAYGETLSTLREAAGIPESSIPRNGIRA